MPITEIKRATALIIEDDRDVQRLIGTTLERAGCQAVLAGNGIDGLRIFFNRRPDLVVLDMMLPDLDGWELCRRLREVSDVPIVVVSAAGSEEQRVRGLEAGADDYVVKPFSPRELAARAIGALRRARDVNPEADEPVYFDARLHLDFKLYEVRVEGNMIKLSPTEFRLLAYLVRNRDRVLTYDQILERVWGDDSESYSSLKRYVSYLRRKLGDDPENPSVILNVRGIGYRYSRQG
jgi:DNA-binding response OmpR family regulator